MLVMLVAGCLSSVQSELVPASRPTVAVDAGIPVEARRCTSWIFGVVTTPADRRTLSQLVAEASGDEYHALVGVTVDIRTWTHPLGWTRCVFVSGRRVLVE